MMSEPKTIFITGVTGTLGKEFIRELLSTTEDRLILLVRRKARFSHWDRVRKILAPSGFERFLGTRVEVLEGDVTMPSFGLAPEAVDFLRKKVSIFYHIAALTALNGSEEECEKINVGGTRRALEFARDFHKNGILERFFYFSTAYAAGSRQTYLSKEDELPARPAHANFYESSKFESETMVRKAMSEGLPVTIFRPSIVVGDSRTGEVSEFNVIYPFIKLFAHGMLTQLPTRPENSFNIVPIDFVIRAAALISKQKTSIGKTFHLVSPEPPSIGMLLRLKDEEYPELPAVEIISPEAFSKEKMDDMSQTVFQVLEPYLGYLNDDLQFEMTNTRAALQGTGLELPKTDYAFLKVLMEYAIRCGYVVIPSRPLQPASARS